MFGGRGGDVFISNARRAVAWTSSSLVARQMCLVPPALIIAVVRVKNELPPCSCELRVLFMSDLQSVIAEQTNYRVS